MMISPATWSLMDSHRPQMFKGHCVRVLVFSSDKLMFEKASYKESLVAQVQNISEHLDIW